MSPRLTRRPAVHPAAGAWTANQMRALVLAVAAITVLLVLGLALAAASALRGHPHPDHKTLGAASPSPASGVSHSAGSDPRRLMDSLAAAPMTTVPDSAALPAPVSTRDPGTLTLPAPTRIGPAGVPTGYPHTPAGALAQLAALDQAALQPGSLTHAREVITAWAAPGGPTDQTWSGVSALASLLTAAQTSGDTQPESGQLALTVTPLMGLVKGVVGNDYVVACVDFEVDVTLAQTARTAAADCQRMAWQQTNGQDGRWLVGPGSEPAAAPEVWPDTDQAIDVGYRDLRQTTTHQGAGDTGGQP